MKKERLLAAIYEHASVVAAMSRMGEEKGRAFLDQCADQEASIAMGVYMGEHKDKAIRFDAIEYEEPCEEHPDQLYVYVHIIVED